MFRIFPSAADFIEGIVAFIQYYGWKQIAILSQDGNLFSEVIELPIIRNLHACMPYSLCLYSFNIYRVLFSSYAEEKIWHGAKARMLVTDLFTVGY